MREGDFHVRCLFLFRALREGLQGHLKSKNAHWFFPPNAVCNAVALSPSTSASGLTIPRSSTQPSSLYWCSPASRGECFPARAFTNSRLMISTMDIRRGMVDVTFE